MFAFYQTFLSIRRLGVPTIAAMNGATVGAGLCLACATDIRLAAPTTTIGMTFVKIGLHPGLGATHFLPLIVGHAVASKLLLTGTKLNGTQAHQMGLVQQLSSNTDSVIIDARALAVQISRLPATAISTLVRTLRHRGDSGLEEALRREADAQAACYAEPDFAERVELVKAQSAFYV